MTLNSTAWQGNTTGPVMRQWGVATGSSTEVVYANMAGGLGWQLYYAANKLNCTSSP